MASLTPNEGNPPTGLTASSSSSQERMASGITSVSNTSVASEEHSLQASGNLAAAGSSASQTSTTATPSRAAQETFQEMGIIDRPFVVAVVHFVRHGQTNEDFKLDQIRQGITKFHDPSKGLPPGALAPELPDKMRLKYALNGDVGLNQAGVEEVQNLSDDLEKLGVNYAHVFCSEAMSDVEVNGICGPFRGALTNRL